MKKTHVGRIVRVATLLVCFIVLFTTCKNNIGMGGTVDVNPPTIRNDSVYPPNNAVIKGAFKLAVKADDDTGVNAVTAVITTADAKNSKINIGNSFLQRPSSNDGYWTLDINPKGEYPIGDGDYKVEIQVTDTAGKVATVTSAFTIDNTPPLLVLDRPSTAVADFSNVDGDTFGDVFWLIGQVYDKSPVAKLEITASPINGGTEYTRIIKNVPANIRLKVDAFSEDKTKSEFYCGLYGTAQENKKKNFRYSLKVTDDAREYKSPGEKAGSGTGNETNIYYLKDDIDKEVMRNRRLQDVYDVLYGTRPESITAEDAEKIKTALKNPSNQIGGGGRTGVFGLNPSLNPHFEIIGRGPSKNVGGVLTPAFSDFYAGSTLQVRLSRNLDDVALKEVNSANAASTDPYQFYLADWNLYKGYSSFNINVASDAGKPGIVRIEREGAVKRENGGYLFTIPVRKVSALDYGKQYVLLVSGTDTALVPNEVIALQNGDANLYGITLVSAEQPPTVSVVKINDTSYTPLSNITGQVYIKKDENISFDLRLSEAATVTYSLKQGTTVIKGDASENISATSGTITIANGDTNFDHTNGGNYQLVIKATNTGGASSPEQTYQLVYDVKGPVVKIAYPIGNPVGDPHKKYIHGDAGTSLEIQGTAFDTGKGLKTTNPITVHLTKEGGSPQTVTLAENGGSWKSSPIDLSQSSYGDGIYTLKVTAKDAFDQETVSELEFTYDQAAPVIKDVHVNGSPVSDGQKVFSTTGAVTVNGNIVETYGLKSFTIDNDDIIPIPGSSFSKTLSLSEGNHDIKIEAKDKADKDTSYTVKVVVDTTVPTITLDPSIPADGKWTNTKTLSVKGAAADATSGIEKIEAIVTGGSPSSTTTTVLGTVSPWSGYLTLNEGDNTVQFKVTDKAGNSNDSTLTPARTIKVDTKQPTITLTTPANGQALIKDSDYTVKVTTNDVGSSGIEKVQYATTVNFASPQTENTSGGVATINLTSIPDGSTTYYFRAVDKAGNMSDSVRVTIQKDRTGPTINVISPVGDYLSKRKPEFEVSITDGSGIKNNTAKVHYKNLATSVIENKDLTENSGSYSFTPPSDLDGNKYEFWFSAEDKAGNSTETSHRAVTIDTDNPVLADVTVDGKGNSTVYIKQGVSPVVVTGKATDANGVAKVEILKGSDVKGTTTTISTPDHSWTINLNRTSLDSGANQLTIRVTDKAGKIAEVQRMVTVDSENPSVTFDSPRNNQIVNKEITIKGTASDNNGLQSVKIVKSDGTELVGVSASSGAVSGDSETAANKALFKGVKAYNWQFNLDTMHSNGELKLKAIATDAAGNTTEETLTLNVDQNSDRPQIVITNLTSLNAGTYLTANTLNFVIIDDDGEIEDGKFEITSIPSAAGTLTKTVSGWQYTFAADGQKILKFKVTDKKGGVFETDVTDKPRVYAKDTTTTFKPDALVDLKVDTKPPQSETPALQFSNASDYSGLNNLEQNAKFKGGMLYLQVMASDASGIQSVTGKIDNVTSTLVQQNVGGAANGHPEKWQIKLDLSAVTEGVKTLTIELTDKAGAKSQFTRGIIVDKTAPTVELTYPEPTDPQAGEITVSGTIVDDGAGVNPDKTKYILGKKASPPTVSTPDASSPADTNGWKPMDTSTKGSWTVKLNLDTVPLAEHGNAVGAYKEIPLYIFTEDEIGNKEVHEKKILFDPDGTKPIVKVLSPQNTTPATKLGGTIQIFGTASVPKGGPAAVGEVYIQFSHNGTFANDTDGTFGTINWYNSGNGQLISGTDTNGGADWRISINGDGSFNHATNQNQDVYFRVRAKNKNGLSTGQWTEKIKIIVDKSAPTIGSPNAVKVDDASSTVLAGSANAKDYTPNMWVGRNKKLIGSLKDDSGIKAVQITSTGLAGGVSYDLDQAKAAGWIADAAGGNYELKIPFNLDALSSTAKEAGEFSVTVSITENTTSPALSTQQTFTFRFDTTDPIGDFGTDNYMNIGTFTSSSITDAQLAQKVKDLGATASSGGGCKILADNHILTVTKVTDDKIEFTSSPALTAGSHSYILYKPETLIYKNGSGKWIVNGVANDSGSGVAEVKVHVTVNGVDSPETVINETHPKNRITKQLGGTVTWKGELDFGSVSDGKGKLHYTITDKSGNTYTTPGVDVVVKNKPVKVSKVILQTEIGGQPVKTDKLNPAETDPQTIVMGDTIDAQLNQTKTVESKNFAFKSTTNSKIKVEFSGGQGTVKYRLRKSDGTLLQDLTAVTSGSEIDLTTHFGTGPNKINNSNGTPTTIKLELWDEAHGYTQGTDSAWAKVDITTLFDALDTKPPTVVILPFHWNSETDNSLYQNSRANGHVEIASSSVSGKVTLRGFAYDNVQLKTLTATLPNASGITVTNTTNNWSIGEDTSKNIKFEVEESKYDYLGYYVKWKLEWDSEKTSVGLGKTISVSAYDGTNPSGTSAANPSSSSSSLTRDTNDTAEHADFAGAKPGQFILFTKGEAQHLTRVKSVTGNKIELINTVDTGFVTATLYKDTTNKPSISVNVVPYITGVSRNSTYNTNRTRSGAIPLLRGEKDNILTGFNLDGSTSSLKITANKDGTGSSPVEMEDLTLSSDKKRFTFKVPDTAKDGYLHLVVNGVAAVNNTNAYTASNMEDSDTYGTAKHSDDRFVHIWRVSKEDTFKGSKNAIYPAMSKGTGGTLYASFSNYSKSEVYYSSAFTGSSTVAVGGTGTTTLFTGYDPPEETDITVNGTEVNVLYAANYHGGKDTFWGDGGYFDWNDTSPTSAGGIYLYDKDAPNTLVGNGKSAKIYRFELFTYDNELQQFKNIRTLRSGNNIYVVYYDRLTGAVKFAWVDDSKTPNTSVSALPWCVIDGNADVTDTDSKVPDAPASAPSNQKTFTFVSPNGSAYASPYVLNGFEDSLSVSNAVWESIAVTVTKDGYPVVVYMDAATGRLRLARSTSTQPTSSNHWKIQKVLASSDPNDRIASDYINACVGSDGILHIAFQNTKGQLVYVKSTNTSDNGSTKYTFGDSEVLDNSGMSIDMTMDGVTPYITYVSRPNSYDAIRIAYKTSMDFNNTGTNVEGWETMTAPLNERAANSRICIETQAKHYNATGTMPVAVGFKTNSDYRAAFYVGK